MFFDFRNCSVSFKLKDFNWILHEILLCNPPLFLMILLTMKDAADPHTTTTRSLRFVQYVFQKCSNALRNFERCEPIFWNPYLVESVGVTF